MAIDIQRSAQLGVWLEAMSGGLAIPPGDYALQAKTGNVDYSIEVAAPTDAQSCVTMVPLEKVAITIPVGSVLRYRVQTARAELHILV